MEKRENWVDQARGFAMFLVVYGHNFPVTEKYIYSFHMPLFLIISGFFFPEKPAYTFLQKKFRTIIVPYFFWAIFLFVFWVILGKNFGDSATKNLSITKNFIGIFFSQGGQEYMDWGIPMWFLPNLFLAFLFLFFCNLYFKKMVFYRFSINFFGNFVSQAIRYSFILEYKYSFGVFVFCGYWKTNLYNNQQNLQKKAHFLDDYFLYYQCFTIPVQG